MGEAESSFASGYQNLFCYGMRPPDVFVGLEPNRNIVISIIHYG